jgi:hypothetical protein
MRGVGRDGYLGTDGTFPLSQYCLAGLLVLSVPPILTQTLGGAPGLKVRSLLCGKFAQNFLVRNTFTARERIRCALQRCDSICRKVLILEQFVCAVSRLSHVVHPESSEYPTPSVTQGARLL